MVDFNKVLKIHEQHIGVLDIKADIDIHNKSDLAEAYTPGVADLAKLIEKDENTKNKVTMSGKLIALVTDGSAVLGLGNIGPSGGLPIVEGKALLYKNFSEVNALPLAVEQVNVDEFVSTMKNIAKSFAAIHLEDIAAPRCFEIEDKLEQVLDIPVYHDDQTGTAIVVLAALINAIKIVGKTVEELHVLINGVGASGLATAKLLYHFGIKHITLVDKYGKITADNNKYNHFQTDFSKKVIQHDGNSLDELICNQDVFIGLSDKKCLTSEQVRKMSKDSIIFALANPIPEILPDEAYLGGAKVVATGSSQYPNQVNNVLVFPGLMKGVLEADTKSIDLDLQLEVAKTISGLTQTPTTQNIITDPFDKNVVPAIVNAIKVYKQV